MSRVLAYKFAMTKDGWVAYVDEMPLCKPNPKEQYAKKIATRAYNKGGLSDSKMLIREENGLSETLKQHTGDGIIR